MLQTVSRWITRITTAVVALITLAIVGLLVSFVLIQGASAQMANALRPPEYPESQLITQWQSGGSDTMWDRRTYQTPDSLEEVLEFYEKHIPGFTQAESTTDNPMYVNGKCDESQLARSVARLINEGHYPWYTADNVPLPCMSISTYQASDSQLGTLFEIWVTWPAQ
jgi:hypothetical protein